MKLSIRAIALVMILVPTLLPALALSVWFTGLRVGDARAELDSRGEREARYLADASALALLVADSETLQRLAASNLQGEDSAVATLFLDADGTVLAAAGAQSEVAIARRCWLNATDCAGGEQRYVFQREVRASTRAGRDEAGAFIGAAQRDDTPELIGRVLLSFDPRRLAAVQRAVLMNSALITLVALLLGSLVARLFARRLTVPMHRLSLVVARIRGGDLGARTQPAGSGELRELEDGVNAMADRVEAAAADLNRRVDEATAELSHALIEREQRNRALDLALERAEAAGRAKDLFLARMSHELRTPLTTVTGFADLMHRSTTAQQRDAYYRSLEHASRLLLATVDDILTFVKMENGSLRLERRVFDLESCIEEAVMMQAPAAHAKGLGLICHVEEGLPPEVVGDSLRVSQVLSNLISNAIKFTRAGQVAVRARRQASHGGPAHLELEVSDTGMGIAPEIVPQLFQPFTQADESITRRFGGSGLGLSITASLVQALEGRIVLQSVPDQGTRVRVELPLEPAQSHDGAGQPALPRLRIALAAEEDNPHLPVLRDYLGRSFEVCEPAAPRSAPAAALDLRVVFGSGVVPSVASASLDRVPVLHLRPIEVVTAADERYLFDCVPLPARRRELLAACLERAGYGESLKSLPDQAEGGEERLDAHCMIVEDNELNRRMIATQLRDMGAQVVAAGSGTEALRLLAREAPDLVLLDVHMPEMDGIALAARVQELHAGLPVYALTANVIGSEEQALAAAGVREVLYKPIDVAKLRAVLRRHARPAERWEILERRGVSRSEVRDELWRLLARVSHEIGQHDQAAAVDAAHLLLGAARMFTRGSLDRHCQALESALRSGAVKEIQVALRTLSRLLASDHA